MNPFNQAMLMQSEAIDPFIQFNLDPREPLPKWAADEWNKRKGSNEPDCHEDSTDNA